METSGWKIQWYMQPGRDPEVLLTFDSDPGRFQLTAADLDGDHIDELVVGSEDLEQDLVVWSRSFSLVYEPMIEALNWLDTSKPASFGTFRKESVLRGVAVSGKIPKPFGTPDGGRIVLLNTVPATFTLGDSVAFGAPVVTAILALRRGMSAGLRSPAGVATALAGLVPWR